MTTHSPSQEYRWRCARHRHTMIVSVFIHRLVRCVKSYYRSITRTSSGGSPICKRARRSARRTSRCELIPSPLRLDAKAPSQPLRPRGVSEQGLRPRPPFHEAHLGGARARWIAHPHTRSRLPLLPSRDAQDALRRGVRPSRSSKDAVPPPPLLRAVHGQGAA